MGGMKIGGRGGLECGEGGSQVEKGVGRGGQNRGNGDRRERRWLEWREGDRRKGDIQNRETRRGCGQNGDRGNRIRWKQRATKGKGRKEMPGWSEGRKEMARIEKGRRGDGQNGKRGKEGREYTHTMDGEERKWPES